ncbi:DUF6323 family protein [Brevibacillus aydinogluensis]|jgi:hypothetical protein|uniref:DUF4065 domain-containing protein n=1 Tax=Brevibacillus aydinogluensis TaxID=927786 RepID=A0AA48M4P0_9BACL|nr:DUF6323 family protein [Brevibacillus aydinogluensis]CAJ1001228.1 DUF4065 domain-containing protein [Brevibacillus aydinogluensis]
MNNLSRLFTSLTLSAQEQHMIQLLELNEKTKRFGLTLAPDDIKELLAAKNQILRHYGRLELGIEATKEIIEVFSESPYITQEHYVSTLHELHEIFYHLKNETEDKIGDAKLIGMMKDCFDQECEGSLELLKDKLEEYAAAFRVEAMRDEMGEDDE